MIPEKNRKELAANLATLDATEEQVKKIGDILLTVSMLDTSRDADYLVETMGEERDPLIRKAMDFMIDALLFQTNLHTPPVKTDGVWFIYGWDAQAYPIGMHTDELEARRIAGDLGYFAEVVFWPNGVLWEDLKRV